MRLALPDPLAEALRRSRLRIIVTGAGGWIGSATLELLAEALGEEEFCRRVVAFAASDRSLRLRTGLEVPLAALARLETLPSAPSLLLHYAFLTRDRVAAMSAEAYQDANAHIGEIVRRAVARLRPRGLFLTSSGAVYGPGGSIDQDLARNPYGVLKHRDEIAFAESCRAAGSTFVAARVFNLAGEYINKLESYALASFLVDARAGRPIVVRAAHAVERSYVHVGDVVGLALAALLDPRGESLTFDTAGERVIEVGVLAELVRELAGRPGLEIHRPPLDLTWPADRYVGDPAIMRSLAARQGLGLADLPQQIGCTAEYLAGTQ
jgi:UDP-glucuronate decarboxylase